MPSKLDNYLECFMTDSSVVGNQEGKILNKGV